MVLRNRHIIQDAALTFQRIRNTIAKRTNRIFAWGLATSALTSTAFAQVAENGVAADDTGNSLLALIPNQNIANSSVMMIIFVGAFAFAMWSATWLIRERRQLDENNRSLAMELADLRIRHDRAQALLDVPDQRVVIWEGREEAPICRGTLPPNTGAPDEVARFIAFGTWMTPESAQNFDVAVDRLRDHAEAFDLAVETRSGSVVEVQGRASGSHAFVRFISLSGDRAALAALEAEHSSLAQTTDTMKSLMEGIPFPVWLRSAPGDLTWANTAFIKAVEAENFDDALTKQAHLLDSSERETVAKIHKTARQEDSVSHFRERLPATVSGDRRMMDVSEIAYDGGTAGIAVDMSEVEEVQGNLRRTLESHAQTMNQLATAVAIFDEHRHLIFHNQAFENLWQLDNRFLDNEPDNGSLFDAMRAAGKLAEQPDWSKWRNDLLNVYQETQPQEHWWHLPDGRTLRVIANPHKQGGVTWVFENITEQLELESRFIALTQVQGETLDHLNEAVAVFSSDGRIKLSNPTFQKLWGLDDEQVAADTPIAKIADLCRPNMNDPEIWDDLSTGITGVSDKRTSHTGRLTLRNKDVLDYALVPLPNGQTMLSFSDVSASVNLERTLKERNDALVEAERLKNVFIEHVSYEFRAPLTNIKGFAEILQQEAFGKLNPKQAEYVDDIAASSNVLHSLVDNLLDLATVDAGIMELDLEQIDMREVLRTAASSVSSKLKEKGLKVNIKQIGGAGQFVADANRVQQVAFNLLSNAISFSPEGGSITLQSAVETSTVSLTVTDEGPGISEEQQKDVFKRFTSLSHSGGRGGAGLGLSISKALVELHGGTVEIDTKTRKGTSIICRFPKLPNAETSPSAQAAQ